ncbi:unnamed protein product [Sphenostylis stenocarpa]|uniref:Uncharacterized protein n=1 Tax=Sphenostylis stenocarpa TaxID=92480 RepID=A0AA86TA17_9FABA|nr:unnamed protein product [Sphenostylis stenocarpa]
MVAKWMVFEGNVNLKPNRVIVQISKKKLVGHWCMEFEGGEKASSETHRYPRPPVE